MKILMFGRGVIAAQYGWALEKAGNEVEFYVRPGRIAEYGPSIDLDLLDGRKSLKGEQVHEKWPITMREEIPHDHDYDLILISVNHQHFAEVAKIVGPRAGNATILIFNNVWEDPQTFARPLPLNQVIWGFPGGGGGFRDGHRLEAGFVKSIFLESAASAASPVRQQSVADLFRKAGFSLSLQKDMRAWYWVHFIMNAGMAAVALKEGSYRSLYQSPKSMKLSVRLMREMLPLIRAKGGKAGIGTTVLLHLPVGLLAFGLRKVLTSGMVAAAVLERAESTSYITLETVSHFPKDVLADARKYNLSLPRLSALESCWESLKRPFK